MITRECDGCHWSPWGTCPSPSSRDASVDGESESAASEDAGTDIGPDAEANAREVDVLPAIDEGRRTDVRVHGVQSAASVQRTRTASQGPSTGCMGAPLQRPHRAPGILAVLMLLGLARYAFKRCKRSATP